MIDLKERGRAKAGELWDVAFEKGFKSDGQEISTIEWRELKNRFPSVFVHK